MKIYNQPHNSRTAEAKFVAGLLSKFPGAEYVPANFLIDSNLLDVPVVVEELVASLRLDRKLPARRKNKAIELLGELPPKIKVAQTSTRISVDVVLVDGCGRNHFFEFHEKQHRSMSVSRPTPVYDGETDEKIYVPRFLQRLVRDVWRVQTLQPYTIVWCDWFETNSVSFAPSFHGGFSEFSLPGKFSFTELLGKNRS